MSQLTIVVANYNNGHLLKGCIDSILSAGYPEEVEIIIIDDRSTDNSREIIRDLAHNNPLQFHFRNQNGGVEATFNTGIALAKGEYLHLFAADDRYLPGTLLRLTDLIKNHPECYLFSSDYASFPLFSTPSFKCPKPIAPLFISFYFAPRWSLFLCRHTRSLDTWTHSYREEINLSNTR